MKLNINENLFQSLEELLNAEIVVTKPQDKSRGMSPYNKKMPYIPRQKNLKKNLM